MKTQPCWLLWITYLKWKTSTRTRQIQTLAPGKPRFWDLTNLLRFSLKIRKCERMGTRLALHARFRAKCYVPLRYCNNTVFFKDFSTLYLCLTHKLKTGFGVKWYFWEMLAQFWNLVRNKISALKVNTSSKNLLRTEWLRNSKIDLSRKK